MVQVTRVGLLLLVLCAGNALGKAQQPDHSGKTDPSCPLPTPKKPILEWSDFSRYEEDNAMLGAAFAGQRRVVFFGSSSIDNWGRRFDSAFFPGKPYINRGISGATTPQMLLRFDDDVVALKPAAVVFLGGTNDIAGNSGSISLAMTEDNIRTMAAIAQANGIRMILASQLPVKVFPWRPCLRPEADLLALTAWEQRFAVDHHLGFVDFYSALADANGAFRPGLSSDGAHPDKKAYEIMALLVEDAISRVLNEQ